MPQEPKPEPTANFTTKAGLPGSPQPLEVKPLATDIKPWDLDQLPKFEHMGKARSRSPAARSTRTTSSCRGCSTAA